MTPSSLVWIALFAWGGTVDLDGDRWRGLQPPEAPADDRAPRPWVAARTVEIVPLDDAVRIRARWVVVALEPGWVTLRLADASVHVERLVVDGRPAKADAVDGGLRLVERVGGRSEIALDAVITGDPRRAPVALSLLPAAAGTLEVAVGPAEAATVTVGGVSAPWADGHFVTAAGALAVSVGPDAPPADRGTLALGRVGVGLTIGDTAVVGRARVEWALRRGSLDRVSLGVAGVGSDLEVTGPSVRGFTRRGDALDIELQAPSHGVVRIDLSWTSPLGGGAELSALLPRIVPQGTLSTETTVQVARDGELDVVPRPGRAEALAAVDLPPWGSGLVAGTPTAAYRFAGAASGKLDLFRLELVSGPPVVVDVASVTAALTDEGRVLMRAHYEVRNERAAQLGFTPPDGVRILGVRVAGETALPTRDGDTWRIPLLRSVDTVEGLLSFPVEITLLGERDAWGRRFDGSLPLPRVDAPVAVTRVGLHLPPGYRNRLDIGDGGRVVEFSEGEGISYGLGIGEVGAARADMLFQSAVQAWMSNDFDEAQAALDDLRALGGESENVRRLQSNLDLVEGRSTGVDVSSARRVKEQAQARAQSSYTKQKDIQRKADEAYRSGAYEEAEELYGQALELNETLEKLEQEESVEQWRLRSEAEKKVAEAKGVLEALKAPAAPAPPPAPEEPEPSVADLPMFDALDDEELDLMFSPGEALDELAGLGGGGAGSSAAAVQTIEQEFIQKIPAGRSYQTSVEMVSGVVSRRRVVKTGSGGGLADADELDSAEAGNLALLPDEIATLRWTIARTAHCAPTDTLDRAQEAVRDADVRVRAGIEEGSREQLTTLQRLRGLLSGSAHGCGPGPLEQQLSALQDARQQEIDALEGELEVTRAVAEAQTGEARRVAQVRAAELERDLDARVAAARDELQTVAAAAADQVTRQVKASRVLAGADKRLSAAIAEVASLRDAVRADLESARAAGDGTAWDQVRPVYRALESELVAVIALRGELDRGRADGSESVGRRVAAEAQESVDRARGVAASWAPRDDRLIDFATSPRDRGPPPVRRPTIRAMGDDKPSDADGLADAPEVHASALSVVIPGAGELVRYQRLLLPEGATWEVPLFAVQIPASRRKP